MVVRVGCRGSRGEDGDSMMEEVKEEIHESFEHEVDLSE